MTAIADHLVYGLRISAAQTLPGIPRARGAGDADVELELGAAPAWKDAEGFAERHISLTFESGKPTVVVEELEGVGTRFIYGEGVRFYVDRNRVRIWTEWDSPMVLADVMAFFTGPILGFLLRERGVLALHASAVVIDGAAYGFVGAGGEGKSTLAAALAMRGHPVLTDDVLALDGHADGWVARAGYPMVRLWEDSARLLFGDAQALPALSPSWDKRGFVLEDSKAKRPTDPWLAGFHEQPARLGGLLVLNSQRTAGEVIPAIAGAGAELLVGLLANTYASYLVTDASRAMELEAIGRLVRGVRTGVLGSRRPDVAPMARAVEAWARAAAAVTI